MGFRRLSFTERRRRRLAKKVDRIDRLETRNTITEPISITGLLIPAVSGLVRLGIMHPYGGSNALSGLKRAAETARQSGMRRRQPNRNSSRLAQADSRDSIAPGRCRGRRFDRRSSGIGWNHQGRERQRVE